MSDFAKNLKTTIRIAAALALALVLNYGDAVYAQNEQARQAAARKQLEERAKQSRETPADSAYPWSEASLRGVGRALRDEYNAFLAEHEFQTKTRLKLSGRFLFVYDVSDGYIEWIAALMNEVGKAFDACVERLGLEVDALDEPMTIVVFASRAEFETYARETYGSGLPSNIGDLTGYYSHRLNRSIVYDRTGGEERRTENKSAAKKSQGYTKKQVTQEAREIKRRDNAELNTRTLVHEAIHQLCYNYGVFSTRSYAPDWVVEGFAMTFEPTAPTSALGWRAHNIFPANAGRLLELKEKLRDDPSCAIVDEVLVSDEFAKRLDNAGYAAAWAVFFYLYKKRPEDLAKYLKLIREKAPHHRYTAEERVADIEACFGPQDKFRADFTRYLRSL